MKAAAFRDSIQLTLAFQQGDEKALEAYFNEFYPALCIYACSFTHDMEIAKDIASEAFFKTWKYRGQFVNPGSIRAYLYKVVRGDAAAWHKKQLRLPTAAISPNLEAASPDPDAWTSLVEAETYRQVYAAIENLPPECRKIFRLLYIEGKKVAEIAKELQLSPSTVKAQKARGLTMLRKRVSFLALFTIVLVQKIFCSL